MNTSLVLRTSPYNTINKIKSTCDRPERYALWSLVAVGLVTTSATSSSTETTTATSSGTSKSTSSSRSTAKAASATSGSSSEASTASEASSSTASSTASASKAASSASSSSASSASSLGLLDTSHLGLGQESLQRQQLIAANVELVARLERTGLETLAGLDGEHDVVHGAQDLVDLADLGLVLQINGGVEVGDLFVDGLADDIALASVQKGTHLKHLVRRAHLHGCTGSATSESASSSEAHCSSCVVVM